MASTELFLAACLLAAAAAVTVAPRRTTLKPAEMEEFFNGMCLVLAEEPSFNHDRLYDIWLNDLNWNTRDVPCDLLAFLNASTEDIRQFRQDMGKLVVRQPQWGAATTVMVDQQQNRLQRRTLLIPDKRKPGRFVGVPNFRAVNPVVHIPKKSVFLLNLQMLMLVNSSYLVIMDCDTGETSLNHRDTLQAMYAPATYQVAFRVPFPVRYSWLYTGEKIPVIPADHPPEPLFV